MPYFKLLVLFSMVTFAHGFFEWKNCVKPEAATKPKVLKAHGCEDKADVVLSCTKGYKIAVLKVFFGHGHGYKATCDSSWFGQNCGTRGVTDKVKFLCQDKEKCTITPTSKVLGSTSCTFGLDADLFVDYVCNKVFIQDVISLGSLNLAPSPLTLPGTVNVSASLTVKRHLPASTKLKLDIQKKLLGAAWVSIPCVSNFGSCTYDNFCELLRGVMFSKCDREMENKGITCDCPIPTGEFTLPAQSIAVTTDMIKKIPVWDWLVNGQYWLKAEFLDVYNRHLGCIQLQVEVDISSKKKKRSLRVKWIK